MQLKDESVFSNSTLGQRGVFSRGGEKNKTFLTDRTNNLSKIGSRASAQSDLDFTA